MGYRVHAFKINDTISKIIIKIKNKNKFVTDDQLIHYKALHIFGKLSSLNHYSNFSFIKILKLSVQRGYRDKSSQL